MEGRNHCPTGSPISRPEAPALAAASSAAYVPSEKELILTKGRFTPDAQMEADRDGMPPIEPIYGERLVNLFEKYELGLKPESEYDLVTEFYRSFES